LYCPPRDQDLEGKPFVNVSKIVRGDVLGEKFNVFLNWQLVFYRGGQKFKNLEMEISVGESELDGLRASCASGNIELEDNRIALKSFVGSRYDPVNVEETLRQAINLPFLILDLRGNLGGSMKHMNHFLSFFLPKGTAYARCTSRGKLENAMKTQSEPEYDVVKILHDNPRFTGKVAILIDRRTCSAAEVVAHTLRSFLRKENRVVIVGQRSGGSVIGVRNPVFASILVSGFYVQYPSCNMLLADLGDPSKIQQNIIESVGVVPDIEVANPEDLSEYLQKAMGWFANSRQYPLIVRRPFFIEERIKGVDQECINSITSCWAITKNDRLVVGKEVYGSRVEEILLYPDSRLRLVRVNKMMQGVPFASVHQDPRMRSISDCLFRCRDVFYTKSSDIQKLFVWGVEGWNVLEPQCPELSSGVIEWIWKNAGPEAVGVPENLQQFASNIPNDSDRTLALNGSASRIHLRTPEDKQVSDDPLQETPKTRKRKEREVAEMGESETSAEDPAPKRQKVM
jgi:hypothetical protein